MSEIKKFTSTGVGNNNRDNRDNKDNRDNICDSISSSGEATPLSFNSSSILSPSQGEGEAYIDITTKAPTPKATIYEEFVHRALFTLFDNGENTYQRYKFQVTINPSDAPSSKHEFIGSLTKDLRNFKKYLPEGIDYEDIKEARQIIKRQHGSYPYLGKLHYNEGWRPGSQKTQNEPECFVIVWYDDAEKGWDFYLKMYAWEHKGSLYNTNLTTKQRDKGIRATDIWFNPIYTHDALHKRNKTFAERMKG